jgi:membrane protease YdiL (CAAX protease family)
MLGYGVLIYLFDGLVYGWLAWRSRSLWMPIGFHLANNFALVVLVNEKANTDLLQGSPLIVVDKLPSFNVMLVASGVVYLLVVVLINWLITRREKNATTQ